MTTSTSPWQRLRLTLDMIKFEHSVFALPFALTGAMLAWQGAHKAVTGMEAKFGWMLLAMVAARSAAMAFNRLLDRHIDARNPRTAMRHLPAGLLPVGFVWSFFGVAVALFELSSAMLGPLCLWLSPVALGVILFYSFTKRFTALSHLVLGLALGIAPMAAGIALTGRIDWRLAALTAGVLCWTAGFDIIYACQDYEFDRASGLHSIPVRLGIARALRVAQGLHAVMLGCLLWLWQAYGLHALAAAGIGMTAALLAYEHSLVKPEDLRRVDAAFFAVNGWVSVIFGACWVLDILWLS
ncbi:MAG: putative 4-hydroxybenzoate polyprenyltransferase [Bryobacteraceae bacterium]|nr:putative 4-hydroxybenzoate polyprenyltransferase [Bryobacteraceae bacterium]